MAGRLYYFVSDVHLGLDYQNPEEREKKFASFLAALHAETSDLYLLGDIFDFWYEYKNVIPRGFTRTLGAIAALVDRGVKVHFFNGNHDIWTYDYLQKELGVVVEKRLDIVEIEGKRFCLGHGDGIWDNSQSYSLLQKIFKSKFLQILFSSLHPRWAFLFGHSWSKHNRLTRGVNANADVVKYVNEESVKWANAYQKKQPEGGKIDYFIFGHHHVVVDAPVDGGRLFVLGDWINNPDCIIFDGHECKLMEIR